MPNLAAAEISGPGYRATHRLSVSGVAFVVSAHLIVLALLASLQVLPVPPTMSALMVEILAPASPQPLIPRPQAQPATPKLEPQRRVTPQPRQLLAANRDHAAPDAEAASTKDSPAAAAPATPAVATSQPRFDADYLSNPTPAYPPLARRMGEEGKVVLRVFVEPQGRPSQIELKLSSNSPRLDQAAQDAVWRWKFIPAKRGDEAIGAWVLVPITFTLKN